MAEGLPRPRMEGECIAQGVADFVRFVLCTNPPLLGQGRPSAFFTFALKASHIGSDANALTQLQRSSTVIILHVMQLRFEKFRVGTTDFSERGADWRIECDSA